MTFEALDDGGRYRLTSAEHSIVLDVSRLRRQYHNLVGELAVSTGLVGTRGVDGVISVANFNLSDARARRERAQTLASNARSSNKIDWQTLLETLCQRVLAAERAGTPAIVLSELASPPLDEELDIEGFAIPKAHPSILFGDGGTLKSMTALLVAGRLVERGLRVALFDWELDQWTHRRRLELLFRQMPEVRYLRCDRPLTHEIDRLARLVEHDALDFAIFDSCGFACDGPPEAAEAALAYFRAVRQLRVGTLHIAHTTKTGELAEQRPFGSAFWHNSARSTWFAKQASVSSDGQVITIGLFNRKANLGPQRPPVAFDVTFLTSRIAFTRVDVAGVEELADSIPLWQRLRRELLSGAGKPKTYAELADTLGVKVDSVEKAVKRKGQVFTRVKSDDGIQRIALVERRAS